MSAERYLFLNEDSLTSVDRSRSGDISDDGDNEYSEFQEIPYSSSSIDRSSISSIPWADDAIKQNQLDWERVDRMFHGQEELTKEVELRNEILEWHRKFPYLLQGKLFEAEIHKGVRATVVNLNDSLDIDTISNCSFNSDEEDEDAFMTPTNNIRQTNGYQDLSRNSLQPSLRNSAKSLEPLTKQTVNAHQKLISLLDRNLRISSVPMKLQQRVENNSRTKNLSTELTYPKYPQRKQPNYKDSFFYIQTKSSPKENISSKSAKIISRMPPILNVLETKRRFRDLATNPSFVQLTHIQAQSAATVNRRYRNIDGERQTWYDGPKQEHAINKNSIILPSINLQQIHESMPITIVSATPTETSSNNSVSNSSFTSGHNHLYIDKTGTRMGRSISAAQNRQISAFYLPYSASKLKMFK